MNIALSSIIIFLFILPGLIFRRFYYSEEFSKQYFKQNPFDVFVSCLFPCLVLHTCACYIASFIGYGVNLEIIGMLVSSKEYPETAFRNINENIGKISLYHISLFSVSMFSGYMVRKIIRKNHLDARFKLLRFRNSWHYLFSGEFFLFPRAAFNLRKDKVGDIELTYVNALVSSSSEKGTVIYDGILVDYELSKEHDLDYITIKGARRRYLQDDPDPKDKKKKRYYNIEGHIIVLPFSNILNLNLKYYKLKDIGHNQFEIIMIE